MIAEGAGCLSHGASEAVDEGAGRAPATNHGNRGLPRLSEGQKNSAVSAGSGTLAPRPACASRKARRLTPDRSGLS
jgi:hypothetical protein